MAYFRDRTEAGEALVRLLPEDFGTDWLVLALPRGGVPVAAVIARHLGSRLDLLLVRKVGAPGNPEVALAAVTGPGPERLVMNERLCSAIGVSHQDAERLAQPEIEEIARRRRLWLGERAPPRLVGERVLLVDDGAATGTTLLAAIAAARHEGARQIAVALPVALPDALLGLPTDVGPVICPYPDAPFYAVGSAYDAFPQVSDSAVAQQLSEFGP